MRFPDPGEDAGIDAEVRLDVASLQDWDNWRRHSREVLRKAGSILQPLLDQHAARMIELNQWQRRSTRPEYPRRLDNGSPWAPGGDGRRRVSTSRTRRARRRRLPAPPGPDRVPAVGGRPHTAAARARATEAPGRTIEGPLGRRAVRALALPQ